MVASGKFGLPEYYFVEFAPTVNFRYHLWGCKFFMAVAGFAKFTNLSRYHEFLCFAMNRREFDSFYLLMLQKLSFIVFYSITDEKDSV